MKSTIKIDYTSSSFGGTPIIKILRPNDVIELQEFVDGDYDVRDKLINDFLQAPHKVEPYNLFCIHTCGTLEKSGNNHVTTIRPLLVEEQFKTFKYNIINRLVPYDTIMSINRQETDPNDVTKYKKVNDFFDWLNTQDWASFDEQQPS